MRIYQVLYSPLYTMFKAIKAKNSATMLTRESLQRYLEYNRVRVGKFELNCLITRLDR